MSGLFFNREKILLGLIVEAHSCEKLNYSDPCFCLEGFPEKGEFAMSIQCCLCKETIMKMRRNDKYKLVVMVKDYQFIPFANQIGDMDMGRGISR